jgi:endoglucanase
VESSIIRRGIACAIAVAAALSLPAAAGAHGGAGRSTRFYTPPPDPGGVRQAVELARTGHGADATRIARMITTPQAVWFTEGTPKQVERGVRRTVSAARRQHRTPVLVAYDLPYRDCGQYSAGGARDTAAYEAWIDGFAKGIGKGPAWVVLEPDGLGIIPYHTPINGSMEWCRPTGDDGAPSPEADPQHRFAQLNYAVDRLGKGDSTRVYLDGTHSAWLGVGDIADRLVKAGVQRADGFFLNASNYQPTPQLTKYGTWISKCIAYGTDPSEGGWRLGHFDHCASQYYPATPGDFGTWGLTDQWYADNVDSHGIRGAAHFVIDTSRNGQGPWTPPAGAYPDPQDWCNPPGRGLGLRPTADTGVPLLDGYLWIKTPGQSDGQCNRGIAGSTTDPEWGGIEDPAAGEWFDAQALQLARLAAPPLR